MTYQPGCEVDWDSTNYEIGLPMAATEPREWRRAAYIQAMKVAPDLSALRKLRADNLYWLDYDGHVIK